MVFRPPPPPPARELAERGRGAVTPLRVPPSPLARVYAPVGSVSAAVDVNNAVTPAVRSSHSRVEGSLVTDRSLCAGELTD